VDDIAPLARRLIDNARESGLSLPASLLFGDGCVRESGRIAAELASPARVFLVLGSGRMPTAIDLERRLSSILEQAGCTPVGSFRVDREPDIGLVDRAVAACNRSRATLIVACGGGSVLDSGKAVAAMTVHSGSVRNYLEGVGRCSLERSPLPVLAIPTTAGTGSEVTRNAVISVPEQAVKRSLRHPGLMPMAAIVDPELTWTTPPSVTAASGMDALTQLLESCISTKSRPETTAMALTALPLVVGNLRLCYSDPVARRSRQAMALVSMTSGVCLANAGLGLVHGIASGLGVLKSMPHGLICAILLPHALTFNRVAASNPLRDALAALLNTPPNQIQIPPAVEAINDLNRDLNIPPDLTFLALSDDEISAVAERSMGSSMSGNPVPMTRDMVEEFLRSVC
jgi:alcohol dehydrogenase class IV